MQIRRDPENWRFSFRLWACAPDYRRTNKQSAHYAAVVPCISSF